LIRLCVENEATINYLYDNMMNQKFAATIWSKVLDSSHFWPPLCVSDLQWTIYRPAWRRTGLSVRFWVFLPCSDI